jgi:hypothetical protein
MVMGTGIKAISSVPIIGGGKLKPTNRQTKIKAKNRTNSLAEVAVLVADKLPLPYGQVSGKAIIASI